MPAPSSDSPSLASDSSLDAVASSTTPSSTSSSMLNRAGVREKNLHDAIELVADGMADKDLNGNGRSGRGC
ncbi:hypothetical protein JCM6882_003734 [Rhodosporidiobolus microsporus]